jgi:hypothetical protein
MNEPSPDTDANAALAARVRRHPLGRLYGRFVRRFAFWLPWQMTRVLSVRTIAEVPDLGPSDAGLTLLLQETSHRLLWDGKAWHFLDDGNGMLLPLPLIGEIDRETWALANGEPATYLRVGYPRLSLATVTTPNLPGFVFRR